ncbi:dihydropteroate synthase [Thermovibrio sp.]
MKVRVRKFKDKRELRDYLLSLGNTPFGADILSDKGELLLVEVAGIDTRAANILKQDAISVGGDCAVPRKASSFEKGVWTVLLILNRRQAEKLIEKLKIQPFGLKELSLRLSETIRNYLKDDFKLSYRGRELSLKEPVVMGILNATPDSFSDGGLFNSRESALKRVEEMLSEGASIIDVGGESTRPGALPVSLEEEIERVVPLIELIRKELGNGFFISVDTYKSEVARLALEAGADVVNDISALQFDPKMVEVVSAYKCPVVLMHIKGTPKNMQENPTYEDVVKEICDYFEERIKYALAGGVEREKIILDPGIGFGKRLKDNLCILKRFNEFKVFGLPLLLGASRKSFIGAITQEEEPRKRLAGSLAAVAATYYKGAKIYRVHDVKETYRFLKLLSAVEGSSC